MAQSFVCERCGRIRVLDQPIVDEIVFCECGFRFYCFGNKGMKITMPAQELCDQVIDHMRRFVQTTGRYRGAQALPSEAININKILQQMDSTGLLEIALEKIQVEVFGRILMHCCDVEDILEIINEDKDAVVKKQNGYVSIKEQKSRKHKNSEIDYLQLVSDTLAEIPGNGTDCREEEQYNQWQIDIMEENARRTGFLFGISG